MATLYATARELSNISCPSIVSKNLHWTSPTLGQMSMIAAEFALVIVLCFYKLNPGDQWQWEDIGYRTGFVASAQMPLIFLLSGKRNIIGWLTGTSYERLNWLHRWVSRILFLSVTIHMGFWFVNWARYDYIKVKLTTDPITQRGFAAWCILLWIVLSSLLPFRRWNYEFFVVQHIVTFAGFLAAVYLHLPEEVKVWIWLPIGFYAFDRMFRALATLLINVPLLNRPKSGSGIMCLRATFQPLSQSTTRIIVENPPMHWRAGQHVFLTCHALAPLQAHPFTIASIPEDGKLEFLVKSKSGATKRFFQHAVKAQSLPVTAGVSHGVHSRGVILEGPYGRIRPLRQFDSVVLIAGSSGATFTVPLMRDIVSSWLKDAHVRIDSYNLPAFVFQGAITRYIRFVWAIKSREQYDWFKPQLIMVMDDVRQLRSEGWQIEVDMSIYVTCDEVSGAENWRPGRQKPLEILHGKREETTMVQKFERNGKKESDDVISIDSVTSNSPSQTGAITGCRVNGTCCCRRTIENEGVALRMDEKCCCKCDPDKIETAKETLLCTQTLDHNPRTSCQMSRDQQAVKRSSLYEIAILSGRPRPHSLIREMLEQALGESAVVVCGSQSLVSEVRQSVVALSDERAVHKGTGAQGIYFHAESFGY
ncbi:MAG: hypothetical protein Q9216_003846 [Gyalolechia sp. 2 TL-2023]